MCGGPGEQVRREVGISRGVWWVDMGEKLQGQKGLQLRVSARGHERVRTAAGECAEGARRGLSGQTQPRSLSIAGSPPPPSPALQATCAPSAPKLGRASVWPTLRPGPQWPTTFGMDQLPHFVSLGDRVSPTPPHACPANRGWTWSMNEKQISVSPNH